ncbi:MAG: hypothetical protein ACI88H_001982 [Cocleimonas sp.]|jgi:hypothetical protein
MSISLTTNNQLAHQAILESMVGLDTPKNQWMSFMTAIDMYVPSLSTNVAGAPSADEFNGSLAEELGFKSNREMLFASKEVNGLGQKEGSWKAMKSAWSVVRQYPYLLKMELTVNAVNSLAENFAFLDVMPTSVDGHKEAEKAKRELAKKTNIESVQHWQEKYKVIEQQLIAANAKLEVFENQQNDNKEQQLKLVEIEKSSAVLKSESEQKIRENTKISKQLKESMEENETLKAIGRFAHLTKFFTG